MTFMEALEKVIEGEKVESYDGTLYDSHVLNPKRLGDNCIITNAVTTKKERENKDWKIFD